MKNKIKAIIIASVLVVVLLLIFVIPKVSQSVLSLSSVKLGDDGKAYYTWYASANKGGENYYFTYTPREYSQGDLTITPSENLALYIMPTEPICKYQASKLTKDIRYLGIKVGTFEYYVLNNPEKSIDVTILDGNGNIKVLDGTSVNSVEIKDEDRTGSVVVETQGLLSGKYNCPDNDNLAIAVNQDGSYSYLYKNELDTFLSSLSSFRLSSAYTNLRNLDTNSAFTNSFADPVTFDGNEVKGVINFGYPTFTITADSDYFDSTYYVEPKLPSPSITSINVPSRIMSDESSSGSVQISNSGSEGTVYMQITSDTYSVSGYQSNFNLGTSKTTYFTIKAPNLETSGSVNVKVCPVSQFTSVECDEESVTIRTIKEEPTERCGDGICQLNENYNTCQVDCRSQNEICDNGLDDDLDGNVDLEDTDCEKLTCLWYQEQKTVNKIDRPWYNVISFGLLGKPAIISAEECRTSSLLWILLSFVLIAGLGSLAILTGKKKTIGRKR